MAMSLDEILKSLDKRITELEKIMKLLQECQGKEERG